MPDKLRIVFMGTPDFAVESLKFLLNTQHTIVGVVTAPDKPSGRGKQMESPAVKKFALLTDLKPILQPESLKDPDFLEKLASLQADLQVVVAFRMLPEVVWSMPSKGTVNLHASLLPDYRGAAPINRAIINGDKVTGITTFFIEKEIDTGNILLQDEVEIGFDMNAGELHDILMVKGARLLVNTVDAISSGTISPIPQQAVNQEISLRPAPKIFKDDCRINWNQKAESIYNFIRGLSPYPAAWTEMVAGEKKLSLKVFKSSFEIAGPSHPTGAILTDGKSFFKVAVEDGFVSIQTLQLAGKKQMDISEFLKGFQSLNTYRLLI
jgi:methionyl-tRNA formyltransferase